MTVASCFEILPAIDLRGGRVVRLRQGDFAQETTFSADPAGVAVGFVDAGARWLHVVDLDGARTGSAGHGREIAGIVAAVGERARVEVAGGLRSEPAIADAIAAGAARVVLGTAALEAPGAIGRLVERFGPDRLAVAIDVRDGLAIGHGWSASAAGVEPGPAIERLIQAGITTFEVTAIDRDGLMDGPDLRLYQQLVATGGAIIASGGISTLESLAALRALGCVGAIVGRAIYEGRLELRAALAQAAADG